MAFCVGSIRDEVVSEQHTMSRAMRDLKTKRLATLLSRANDVEFLMLCWAVHGLQSGRQKAVDGFLSYPAAAVSNAVHDEYKIHPWELETLITLLFQTPKARVRQGLNRRLNCTRFEAMGDAINLLRSLENAESGLSLGRVHILTELHRVGQRQFPWQLGHESARQIYRYAYIYGQGRWAEEFSRLYGLSVADFMLAGFLLFATSREKRVFSRAIFSSVKFDQAALDRAFALIARPLGDARNESLRLTLEARSKHQGVLPVAYRPSVLRRSPAIVVSGQIPEFIVPLPELALQRVTSGLYFDMVDGGQDLRNDANSRFETYAASLISAAWSEFSCETNARYRVDRNTVEAPDVLVHHDGRLDIIVECKATRLTFQAQFAEDPFDAAERQYEQIAKGIFQLWRYFSHLRRGIAPGTPKESGVAAVVLTLDSWLMVSEEIHANVFERARELAASNSGICEEDHKPVLICPVHDFERVLMSCESAELSEILRTASEARFNGWFLSSVVDELGRRREETSSYPFSPGELLPWWDLKSVIQQSV